MDFRELRQEGTGNSRLNGKTRAGSRRWHATNTRKNRVDLPTHPSPPLLFTASFCRTKIFLLIRHRAEHRRQEKLANDFSDEYVAVDFQRGYLEGDGSREAFKGDNSTMGGWGLEQAASKSFRGSTDQLPEHGWQSQCLSAFTGGEKSWSRPQECAA